MPPQPPKPCSQTKKSEDDSKYPFHIKHKAMHPGQFASVIENGPEQ